MRHVRKVIGKKLKIDLEFEDFIKLVESHITLQALQNGGVDNWDWYSDSLLDAGVFKLEEQLDELFEKNDVAGIVALLSQEAGLNK